MARPGAGRPAPTARARPSASRSCAWPPPRTSSRPSSRCRAARAVAELRRAGRRAPAARTAARAAHAGAVRRGPAGRGAGRVRGRPAPARRRARRRPVARAGGRPPGGPACERPTRPARQRPAAPAHQLRRPGSGSSTGSPGCRDARLVTLVGPGGAGKTRLASRSARRGRPRGVLRRPGRARRRRPGAAGRAGRARPARPAFRPRGRRPGRAAWSPRSATAELLLVLDNCEHVVDAVAALARTLLAECPALRGPGHQPRAARPHRRDAAAARPARHPACGRDCGRGGPLPRGAAVRRPRGRGAAGFAVGRDDRRRGRSRSARRSTACRWPSSWPPRGCARSPSPTSPNGWPTHGRFRLLSRGDRRPRPGTGRCARWSSGAGTCSAPRSGCWPGGSPCSPAAPRSPRSRRSAAWTTPTSCWPTWWTSRWSSVDGARYRMLRHDPAVLRGAAGRGRGAGAAAAGARALPPRRSRERADPHLRRAEQLDWLALLAAEHDNLMAALRWAVRSSDRDARATAFRLVSGAGGVLVAERTAQRGRRGRHRAARRRGRPTGWRRSTSAASCTPCRGRRPSIGTGLHGSWARSTGRCATRSALPCGAWPSGRGGRPARPNAMLGDDPWNVALVRLSRGLLAAARRPDRRRRAGDPGRARPLPCARRAVGHRAGPRLAGATWRAGAASGAARCELWARPLARLRASSARWRNASTCCAAAATCLVRQGDTAAAEADLLLAAELSTQGRAARPAGGAARPRRDRPAGAATRGRPRPRSSGRWRPRRRAGSAPSPQGPRPDGDGPAGGELGRAGGGASPPPRGAGRGPVLPAGVRPRRRRGGTGRGRTARRLGVDAPRSCSVRRWPCAGRP